MISVKKRTRILIIAGILVVTVSFLSYGMLALFVDPYLSVDEVVTNPESYMGKTIQVKGTLQPDSISDNPGNVTLVIEGEEHALLVIVETELPTLTDGQDMVAIGTLEQGDHLLIRASEILAQCPSKYEVTT